jgi:hypothetical protein
MASDDEVPAHGQAVLLLDDLDGLEWPMPQPAGLAHPGGLRRPQGLADQRHGVRGGHQTDGRYAPVTSIRHGHWHAGRSLPEAPRSPVGPVICRRYAPVGELRYWLVELIDGGHLDAAGESAAQQHELWMWATTTLTPENVEADQGIERVANGVVHWIMAVEGDPRRCPYSPLNTRSPS